MGPPGPAGGGFWQKKAKKPPWPEWHTPPTPPFWPFSKGLLASPGQKPLEKGQKGGVGGV